ncbi:MAG TPA: hypothetical protein PK031_01535, partial [Pseudomonadales bacterium]|nr:hypothetical protein [Pseudomonadales bacterium]
MKILLCGSESPLGRSLEFRLEQLPFPVTQMTSDKLASIPMRELESLLSTKGITGIVNVQH